jgi:hypothetical protein
MVNEGRVGEIVRCTGVLKKGDLVSPELDNNTVINWDLSKNRRPIYKCFDSALGESGFTFIISWKSIKLRNGE